MRIPPLRFGIQQTANVYKHYRVRAIELKQPKHFFLDLDLIKNFVKFVHALGPNKHQSAVTCLQFNSRFVITSSDDGTVKLWDVRTGEFIRNLVTLESGGSGGVVWRIR